jgi:2-keto-4-pentenoate hydratase/2-oxohepta-3-ene-1,7-dioic acid hydratase in catechol pathway
MSWSIGNVERDGTAVAVISVDGRLYEIGPASQALLGRPSSEVAVLGLLERWEPASGKLAELAQLIADGRADDFVVSAHDGWLPPVIGPRKVIGIGANYKDHLDYARIPHPTTPYLFLKPQQLGIRLMVDGDVKQDGNTRNMVFGVAELVAHASSVMTLEPGDVFLTGTPLGSGFAVDPPQRLTPGQTMVVEVDGLAPLTTPTMAEGVGS